MNPEFSRSVDEAAKIGASGRWGAVNAAIERIAANPGVDNAWYVQVLGALCSKVFSEYMLLKTAYASRHDGDVALLAWRARNLLELAVWSTYCTKSKENARRFYVDVGRDVLDVYGAFEKWGSATAQCTYWLQLFTNAKQDVSRRAASEGIETLEGPYTQVSKVAKECGMEIHFKTAFKMFSKFAHPTAMQIMTPPDDAEDTLQRDCFYAQGCLYFTGAFAALEGELIKPSDNFTAMSSPRDRA
jgi:Family of unknown function (DUF5677)